MKMCLLHVWKGNLYQSKPAKICFFYTEISRYIRPGTHWHLFPSNTARVFLLLAEYHLKRMFKEPTIRNSYQFSNVSSHELHGWKVDEESSTLRGLVVKLYNRK